MFFIALILLTVSVRMAHAAQTTQNCGLLPQNVATQITDNEPWYCAINQQVYSQWANDIPYVVIMVFISFMIAAIIFMAGVALNSNRIRNFAMGELYEAIATAIIAVFFLYVCAVVFGIIPGILVGNINPYATAFNLIGTTISSAQNMYSSIFSAYYTLSASISPSVDLTIGAGTSTLSKSILTLIGASPNLFLSVVRLPVTLFFLEPANAISQFLVDGIAALYAEYYLMVFFSVAAIPAFFIPGILLRSLFPTRALGGILIAFAFGFYLIMPSLFAVAYYFTAPSVQRDMASATFHLQQIGTSPGTSTATSSTSPLVMDLQSARSSLSGFWLLILFYPGVIIAITYATIVEIANFIGRASTMGGRMRSFI